ncbi:MAG TPA: MarR family transcriptional regulator [Gaiellaceae bacterium]|nr:MarR family transcriptional regulator [Gaiellaceae bacterium]
MADADHIDRLLERLASMPGVDTVDPLAEGISDRIAVIGRRFMLRSKESLDGHGITWRDWQVLTNLLLAGDTPTSPSDLSSRLMVTTGAMTNVLDRLEQRGLIRRVRNPDDRRSIIVEATDAGSELWHVAVNELGEQEAAAVHVLSRREQEQLNGLLRKLLAAFPDDEDDS